MASSSQHNKRRNPDGGDVLVDEKSCKVRKVEKSVAAVGLLSLSDDVLLEILRFLDSADLFNLTETSARLRAVASDETLWRTVDTSRSPLRPSQFQKLVKFVGPKTRSVRIGGIDQASKVVSVTPAILDSIRDKCPNISELVLENCFVDAEKITLSMFPRRLRKLGLVSCNVVNISPKESYLFKMHIHMPELEALDLTNATWLSNHSLQAMCKCDTLVDINLRGCRRIGECLAYTMLSTRFGFRRVRSLNLQDTSIGDSEVPCFGRLPEMTHLYLGRSGPNEFVPPPPEFESNGIITDRGVNALCLSSSPLEQNPSKLETLSLMWTRTTDKCLPKLASHLHSLKHLDMRGTKVSNSGVDAFKAHRAACEILYDSQD